MPTEGGGWGKGGVGGRSPRPATAARQKQKGGVTDGGFTFGSLSLWEGERGVSGGKETPPPSPRGRQTDPPQPPAEMGVQTDTRPPPC